MEVDADANAGGGGSSSPSSPPQEAQEASVLALLEGPSDERRLAGLYLLARTLKPSSSLSMRVLAALPPAFMHRLMSANDTSQVAVTILTALCEHPEAVHHETVRALIPTATRLATTAEDADIQLDAIALLALIPATTDPHGKLREALLKVLRTPTHRLTAARRQAALALTANLASKEWLAAEPPFAATVAAVVRAEVPVALGEGASATVIASLALVDALVEVLAEDDDEALPVTVLQSLEGACSDALAYVADAATPRGDLDVAIIRTLANFLAECPLALGATAPAALPALFHRAQGVGGDACAASLLPYAALVAAHPPAKKALRSASPCIASLLGGDAPWRVKVLEVLSVAYADLELDEHAEIAMRLSEHAASSPAEPTADNHARAVFDATISSCLKNERVEEVLILTACVCAGAASECEETPSPSALGEVLARADAALTRIGGEGTEDLASMAFALENVRARLSSR
ncbi:hypothetical protein PPROV_000018400 [Pycnococcus provasolii]|uniref:Uncharacterized protein n=1 Tax=Pycnococcus provasolii TaxID=41880 RepID=A0A830H489_9CHLO|nr:hypothetical protein PPROV_000018400 [Pycnococcus provasolii]